VNKADLIEAVAKDAGLSKKAANEAIDSIIAHITKTLKKGGEVTLIGFGTFGLAKRAARTGRNPQTGATIKIKAKKVPRFKAGAALKKAVA
jgi:DNA-binding protein HU-beta